MSSDSPQSLRKPVILTIAMLSLFIGLVLFGPKSAQAATPVRTNTLPVEGVFVRPPACVYSNQRQMYWFFVRNTSNEAITAFVRPSSTLGSGHTYATPSLRGSIAHGLYWPVRLDPGKGRFVRVDYMPGRQNAYVYSLTFWVGMLVTVDGHHGNLYYSNTADFCDPVGGGMK